MIDIAICLSFAFILLGVLLGWLIIHLVTRHPGNELSRKFVAMGDLRGKTYMEIQQVVGKPLQKNAIKDGVFSAAWSGGGYYICLWFENNICQGITDEISV